MRARGLVGAAIGSQGLPLALSAVILSLVGVATQPSSLTPVSYEHTSATLVVSEGAAPPAYCFGGCAGVGRCVDSHCVCPPGRAGVDCAEGATTEEEQGGEPCQHGRLWGQCAAPPQRPRIFIYDLPGEMVWGGARDVDFGRPMSIMLLERLLVSVYRTANPNKADFFFIPSVGGAQGDYLQRRQALDYVKQHWPEHWGGQQGRNHLMVGPDDSGTFAYFPNRMQEEDARALIFLHHNGLHTGMGRNGQPGTHIPGQDIIIPPLQIASHIRGSQVLRGQTDRLAPRERLLFFSGTILDWNRRPGPMQSGNARKEVLETARTENSSDVLIHPGNMPTYYNELAASTFCVAPAGKGGAWGRVLTLAAIHGCVPVMVQDNTSMALEELVPWQDMAVLLPEAKIPNITDHLRAIPWQRVRQMQLAIACHWPRLLWSSIDGTHAGEGPEDDAFDGIIWVLRRRLGLLRRGVPSVPDCPGAAVDPPFGGWVGHKRPSLGNEGGKGPLCRAHQGVDVMPIQRCPPNPCLDGRFSWPQGGAVCFNHTSAPGAFPPCATVSELQHAHHWTA